jgi:pimeloyl-ACP methyl ester carboxylesterase
VIPRRCGWPHGAPATGSTLGGVAPDIRAYLQIRTAGPSGFNRDGSKLLISSNMPGTFQVHRLDIDRLSGQPVPAAELVRVTGHSEPVGGSYLPDADRLLLVTDAGGDERQQILLGPDDPARPLAYDDLENTAAWRRAWREREYGSLAHDRELLERLSPITHVERLRAPLMVIHGRNDPRVPLGEAEQIHAVARSKGLRSDLLVYDDEGHGLAKLRNRLDAYPRVAAFLHEVLAPGR